MSAVPIVPIERIERAILLVRGQKVMLATDLAKLYGTTAKRLNEQVRRNRQRFPEDFVFQLTKQEFDNLRSQTATSSWGGQRYAPFAFTEHGAVMLASVLNTPTAVMVSVQIVRTFLRLRALVASHRVLAEKLSALELKSLVHDEKLREVFAALRKLGPWGGRDPGPKGSLPSKPN